jgi:hypothetical protein
MLNRGRVVIRSQHMELATLLGPDSSKLLLNGLH